MAGGKEMITIKYTPGFFAVTKGCVGDNDVIAISDKGKVVMSSCLPVDLQLAEEYVQCMMNTIKQYKEVTNEK